MRRHADLNERVNLRQRVERRIIGDVPGTLNKTASQQPARAVRHQIDFGRQNSGQRLPRLRGLTEIPRQIADPRIPRRCGLLVLQLRQCDVAQSPVIRRIIRHGDRSSPVPLDREERRVLRVPDVVERPLHVRIRVRERLQRQLLRRQSSIEQPMPQPGRCQIGCLRSAKTRNQQHRPIHIRFHTHQSRRGRQSAAIHDAVRAGSTIKPHGRGSSLPNRELIAARPAIHRDVEIQPSTTQRKPIVPITQVRNQSIREDVGSWHGHGVRVHLRQPNSRRDGVTRIVDRDRRTVARNRQRLTDPRRPHDVQRATGQVRHCQQAASFQKFNRLRHRARQTSSRVPTRQSRPTGMLRAFQVATSPVTAMTQSR